MTFQLRSLISVGPAKYEKRWPSLSVFIWVFVSPSASNIVYKSWVLCLSIILPLAFVSSFLEGHSNLKAIQKKMVKGENWDKALVVLWQTESSWWIYTHCFYCQLRKTKRCRMETAVYFVSLFTSRLVDLPVGFSAPQPKADRGRLSVTSHLPAQTSRPVFLIYFLLRLPATAQDRQGDPLCSLRSSVRCSSLCTGLTWQTKCKFCFILQL